MNHSPRVVQHTVPVVENVQLAKSTFRLRVADREIGRLIRPGQFVMLRVPGCTDPLLGRPFALYDTFLDDAQQVAGYDLVYLVVGKMTGRMSRLTEGDSVEIWGPMGNGFSLTSTRHLLMVAGGIGQTPFPAVARACRNLRRYGDAASQSPTVRLISLAYGVRSAEFLAGVADFASLSVSVAISTDDGSSGHHGRVTDLVSRALASSDPPTRILGCGPEPMMHRLAELALAAGVPCELSLETPMACGIGACFSCVAKIRQENGEWDYRRVCVEGPVFDASRVVF